MLLGLIHDIIENSRKTNSNEQKKEKRKDYNFDDKMGDTTPLTKKDYDKIQDSKER